MCFSLLLRYFCASSFTDIYHHPTGFSHLTFSKDSSSMLNFGFLFCLLQHCIELFKGGCDYLLYHFDLSLTYSSISRLFMLQPAIELFPGCQHSSLEVWSSGSRVGGLFCSGTVFSLISHHLGPRTYWARSQALIYRFPTHFTLSKSAVPFWRYEPIIPPDPPTAPPSYLSQFSSESLDLGIVLNAFLTRFPMPLPPSNPTDPFLRHSLVIISHLPQLLLLITLAHSGTFHWVNAHIYLVITHIHYSLGHYPYSLLTESLPILIIHLIFINHLNQDTKLCPFSISITSYSYNTGFYVQSDPELCLGFFLPTLTGLTFKSGLSGSPGTMCGSMELKPSQTYFLSQHYLIYLDLAMVWLILLLVCHPHVELTTLRNHRAGARACSESKPFLSQFIFQFKQCVFHSEQSAEMQALFRQVYSKATLSLRSLLDHWFPSFKQATLGGQQILLLVMPGLGDCRFPDSHHLTLIQA